MKSSLMRLPCAIGERKPFRCDVARWIKAEAFNNFSDLVLVSKARLQVFRRLFNRIGIVPEGEKLLSGRVPPSRVLLRLGSLCLHRHLKNLPEHGL